MIYLSTVGVYGDRNGEVVTEATPVGPQTARSKRRVAAEEQWRAACSHLEILRLPGIYGPFRGPLAKARFGSQRFGSFTTEVNGIQIFAYSLH